MTSHPDWLLGGGILLLGLVLGLKDLVRISLTRIWALSTVTFRQSIRRRVLWITPLVILGVIFWILGAMGRAVGGRRHYY